MGESHELIGVYPYATPIDLLKNQTMHPYDPLIDGTPTVETEAPANPGTETVEEEAAKAFDESEFMQSWLKWAEEPEPKSGMFPDPKYTEKEVSNEERRCERGISTFSNVEGNEAPEPFATREPTAFTIGTLPKEVESPSPVYLRYGETYWKPAKNSEVPKKIDGWGGWGFRHIAAKHGWNPLDRVETEAALASATPETTGRGTWRYDALDVNPGTGGVECTRRVIVDFVNKEGNPAPRGIVTSYNYVGLPEE